jgi:hypothetical protein
MNVDPTPQTTQPGNIGKRISDLWNSRNRIAMLFVVLSSGLVLNCCCLIIPLWGTSGGR